MMKKVFLYITAFILYSGLANAQSVSLERQVIGSTGSLVDGTNYSFYSTVGEVMIKTFAPVASLYNLTQGFQQPEIKVYGEELVLFSGFSPNGDGTNDLWIIENIESYPENTVSIFNRWGTKIWGTSGYNNDDNVWNGTGIDGKTVGSGTYFYIIKTADFVKKGWVEVTK